jgi:Tat protein translocase TatB subunit
MFGIGMPELLVIAVVALIVVGPKKLPEIAKALGKGLSEFRKVTEEATETIKETLKTDEMNKEINDIKDSLLSGKGDDKQGQVPPTSSGPAAHSAQTTENPKPQA